jgi:hypothetical protein
VARVGLNRDVLLQASRSCLEASSGVPICPSPRDRCPGQTGGLGGYAEVEAARWCIASPRLSAGWSSYVKSSKAEVAATSGIRLYTDVCEHAAPLFESDDEISD